MIRSVSRRLCLYSLRRRALALPAEKLRRSAVVFSPHYDDETLGTGGTVALKRRLGAAVHLVFMTDGSRSHAHAMEAGQLSVVRRGESITAAAALGVPENHVHFLELPETRLADHRADAVARVRHLLEELRCEQVYVPSRLEPLIWSSDHVVTTEVVFRALAETRQRPEIFEYLVWFWYHWPWVPVVRNDAWQLLALTWQNRLGFAAAAKVNTAVAIGDVLDRKRIALDAYASQMTRLLPGAHWPVLGDMAAGEFLRGFFEPTEFFTRYMFEPQSIGGCG